MVAGLGTILVQRRIDPDGLGQRQRRGRLVYKPFWTSHESGVECRLPRQQYLRCTAVVNHRRREHADARVVVFMVVPVEERFAESMAILLRAEPIGKLRPVLHRLELAFGKGVVVRHVRSAVRFHNAQRGQELGYGVRFHRWSSVAMDNQFARVDVLPDDRVADQSPGQVGIFT